MAEPATDQSRKERLPWDRLEGEPPKAYQHFAAYRDRGRGRTIYDVADTLKRARGYLYQLSRDWQWVRRAEAWDRELDRVFAEKMADRRRRSAENTLLIVGAARNKLVERLQTLNPNDLSASQWIQWFEALTRIEREAMGQPGSVVAHTGVDGGPIQARIEGLTDAERRAYLLKLVAEAQSRGGLSESSGDEEDEEEGSTEPPMTEHGSTSGP